VTVRLANWGLAARFASVTLVALLAATMVNFAVTFSGPPPLRRPLNLNDLVPALEGRGPIPDGYGWVAQPRTEQAFRPQEGELAQPAIRANLARVLNVPLDQVGYTARAERRPIEGPRSSLEARDGFSVGLQRSDGTWRIIRGTPAPLLTAWHWLTLSLTLIAAFVFAGMSMLVARSVVRPLERLGREADQAEFGRIAPISVDGPPEVVRVANAVIAMRDRLADALESRTAIFTAVAHDMAAPLAWLRFRLVQLPDEQRIAAERDVDELSAMIAGILELSSASMAPPQHAQLDAIELARVVATAEGLQFQSTTERAVISGDALSLRRLLTNLCANAKRYAGGGMVVASVKGDLLQISVLDEGPGFPPDQAERLFEPFYRVEGSRSRATAGAGLGLAIARGIAEAHGGKLVALVRDTGGAEFRLSVPVVSS